MQTLRTQVSRILVFVGAVTIGAQLSTGAELAAEYQLENSTYVLKFKPLSKTVYEANGAGGGFKPWKGVAYYDGKTAMIIQDHKGKFQVEYLEQMKNGELRGRTGLINTDLGIPNKSHTAIYTPKKNASSEKQKSNFGEKLFTLAREYRAPEPRLMVFPKVISSWNPSGERFAVVFSGRSVWTGGKDSQLLSVLTTFKDTSVHSLAWHPAKAEIALGCTNRVIRFINSDTGDPKAKYQDNGAKGGYCRGLSYSLDGRLVAALENRIRILSNGKPGVALSNNDERYISSVSWSPDGKYFASCGRDNRVWIWEATSQTEKHGMKAGGNLMRVAWSPDGTKIASCGWNFKVTIWDAKTGAELKTLEERTGNVLSIAWSPNSKWVASGGVDTMIHILNVETGKLHQAFKGHADAVDALDWNPNGDLLLSASRDNTVRIWHVKR
jgi:WD40 repeat protein